MGIIFFIFLNVSSTGFRSDALEPTGEMKQTGDVTKEVIIGNVPRPEKNKIFSKSSKAENWVPTDSHSFSGRIRNNGHYYLKVSGSVLTPYSEDGNLTSTALQAINAAPSWLRLQLLDNLARLGSSTQDVYANLILTSPSLWQDEIAFVIAHLDSAVLEHHKASPTIFTDNAKLIYKNDSLLDYVRLVEYGNYTTAKYKIANNGSDTTEIEIPYEMYYWNVVHPVVENEAPLYVNPRTADAGCLGAGEATPPTGRFWRDYIFNYPDTTERTVTSEWPDNSDVITAGTVSPILRTRLSGEKILYNGKIDNANNNGAIGRITNWINEVMVFAASTGDVWDGERGWQPNRIYHMHRGRCGEHSYILSAAGRSALIPMNSPYDITRDHVWNEWYDTQWRGWEPINTYINSTSHYEDGGWEFRILFCWRGDGYTWDVTPRYSQHSTLTVNVKDVNSHPVDGARIYIYTVHYSGSPVSVSDKRYTDSDGRAEFLIGENIQYYASVDAGSRGKNPASGYVSVIGNSGVGQQYTWNCNLSGTQPTLSTVAGQLADTTKYYKIDVNFSVPKEIIRGKAIYANEFNNGTSRTCWQRYGYYTDGPQDIEFFICNATEFAKYQSGSTFSAFEIGHNVDAGDVSFVCPEDDWYVVFSTKDLVENEEVINLDVKLYTNVTAVEEGQGRISYFNVLPTPFRDFTYLDFMVPKKKTVRAGLYDLSGRCVKEIVKGELVGKQHIKIDGRQIGEGIYFIRLNDGNRVFSKKLVKI